MIISLIPDFAYTDNLSIILCIGVTIWALYAMNILSSTLILNSNNIYLIDSGKVVDNGKHEELLAKSKIYKNFHDKQIKR